MMMRDLRSENLVLDDPETTDYLQALGGRIGVEAQDGEQRLSFFAVRDPSINAFALPGGFIGVNTGLILRTNSESELAGVVAHEIGHVVQRHIARAVQAQSGSTLAQLAGILGAVLVGVITGSGDAVPGLIAMGQGVAMQKQINFTRMEEHEADRVGISYMASAGFDPNGMAGFFATMMRERGVGGEEIPSLLLTHPVDSLRIAEARARIASLTHFPRRPDTPTYPYIRERLRVISGTQENDQRRYYERMLASDPNNAALQYGAALAETKSGNPRNAIALLQPLVAAQPQLPLLQGALAQAQLAASRRSDGIASFEHALELAPRNVPAYRAFRRSAAGDRRGQARAPAAAGPVQQRDAHPGADPPDRSGRQFRRRHRGCVLLHGRTAPFRRRPDAGEHAAGPGAGFPRDHRGAAQALPGPPRGNPRLPARAARQQVHAPSLAAGLINSADAILQAPCSASRSRACSPRARRCRPAERDPRDRFERSNRAVYRFNDSLDRHVAKPVAKAYVKVTPRPVRSGVSNFFNNLAYPTVMVNSLLQGKVKHFFSDTARLVVNTTIGIGGLFDPASQIGLPSHDEDFGQTLGKWGRAAGGLTSCCLSWVLPPYATAWAWWGTSFPIPSTTSSTTGPPASA